MTKAQLRRFARRTAKRALGTVQLEHVQDIRQAAATERREGCHRSHMALLLTEASRYRRIGLMRPTARALIAAAREHRRALFWVPTTLVRKYTLRTVTEITLPRAKRPKR